jgi:hypothetical protein
MVNAQNTQKVLQDSTQKTFALNVLAGSIGKAVIEAYFVRFGYEVYPFGYENHYANVTRFLKRDSLKETITKIRAMPDLLVFNREKEENYLVEIKASNCKKELGYWIEEERFDCYRQNWQDAVLVIYLISSGEVICKRISEIKHWTKAPLPNKSKPGYYLDLNYFSEFPEYFTNIDRKNYVELSKEIQKILRTFGNDSIPQKPLLAFRN